MTVEPVVIRVTRDTDRRAVERIALAALQEDRPVNAIMRHGTGGELGFRLVPTPDGFRVTSLHPSDLQVVDDERAAVAAGMALLERAYGRAWMEHEQSADHGRPTRRMSRGGPA